MENYFKTNYQFLENGNVVDNIPYYLEEESFVLSSKMIELLNELIVRYYGVSYPTKTSKIGWNEQDDNSERIAELKRQMLSLGHNGIITVEVYGHILVIIIDESEEYKSDRVKLIWTRKINLDVIDY